MKNMRFQFTWVACFLILAFLFSGCSGGTGSEPAPGPTLEGLEITVPSGAAPEVPLGGTLALAVAYTPSNTSLLGVSWRSSNIQVATVTSAGVVTGVAVGTATITATSTQVATINNTLEVTVVPVAVTGITIASGNNIDRTIVQYGELVLTAVITPPGATNKSVTWESADPTKVTVTQDATNGLRATLNALEPTGTPVAVTVTTADGDFTATCNVTVTPFIEVTGIALSESTLTVMEGSRKPLTVTFTPDDASDKIVSWLSADSTKVTVPGSGVSIQINGIAETTDGPVTITATATTRDGTQLTATCEVTVRPLSYTTVFEWDASTDPNFADIELDGTRTMPDKDSNLITVKNYSTTSSNDSTLTTDPELGRMLAKRVGDAIGASESSPGTPVLRNGYYMQENPTPCLQFGSTAFTRTTTSSAGNDRDGNPVAGQFDLSKPYRITVEYTLIETSGQVLVAVLNNTGSVNTSNSVLRNDSGEFKDPEEGAGVTTFVHTKDQSTSSYYEEALPFLEHGFFIVRKTAGGSMVLHSVKLEIADD